MIRKINLFIVLFVILVGCAKTTSPLPMPCNKIIDDRIKTANFDNLTIEELIILLKEKFQNSALEEISSQKSWSWEEGDRRFHAEIGEPSQSIREYYLADIPTINNALSCIGQPEYYETLKIPNTTRISLLYPNLGLVVVSDLTESIAPIEVFLGRKLSGDERISQIIFMKPGTKEQVIETLVGKSQISLYHANIWPGQISSLPEISKWESNK